MRWLASKSPWRGPMNVASPPSGDPTLNRRRFLRLSLEASGGLLLSFAFPDSALRQSGLSADEPPEDTGGFVPNAWIRIEPTGSITVLWEKSEMGQGVSTALPMIVAEELDVDWEQVRTERAPTIASFSTETGGSSSIRTSYDRLRRAGAMARA